jgi:hypothetical protein
VQVYDAVACFQHAGVVVPTDCIDALSTCRRTVQKRRRTDLNQPGTLHVALAQAVEELLQEAASPAHVEARESLRLQCPSVHLLRRLLAVADSMRACVCFF